MLSGSKTYLITGGSGFIGSKLALALVEKGNKVIILDNEFRNTGTYKAFQDNHKDMITYIKADVCDRNAVLENTANVDAIVHLAAINGTGYFYEIPHKVLEVGLKGTLNTLEACVIHSIDEYFYASSSEVCQIPQKMPIGEETALIVPNIFNPRYSYCGSKIVGELLTLNYGLVFLKRAIIFRPYNIYGPGMGYKHVIPQFIRKMMEKQSESFDLEIQGTGEETRAFCYIDDFIRGLLLTIEKGEHLNIYNIGNAEEVTIRELALLVAGKMNKYINIVSGEEKLGGIKKRCPDIAKLSALGYRSEVSLNQGLEKTIRWYMKEENR